MLYAMVFLAALLPAGCSDPYAGRMEVSGAVKLKGEPLKDGSITFVPLDGQGTQSGAPIENGVYKVPRKSGLKPGKYLVQITSGDGKTPAAGDEAAAPGGSTNIVSLDRIPEDWNVRSKQQVEVRAKGPNTFNFDIPNVNTKRQP
jgi:hypothetical protein